MILRAIDATFKNRGTGLPAEDIEAFTTPFVREHLVQWNTFAKRIGEAQLKDRFGVVVDALKTFATPMFRALALDERLGRQWRAGSGWVD